MRDYYSNDVETAACLAREDFDPYDVLGPEPDDLLDDLLTFDAARRWIEPPTAENDYPF